MLTPVQALLCSQGAVADSIIWGPGSSHDHDPDEYLLDHIEEHSGDVSPDPDCKTTAAIREAMGRASYDLSCEDARSDQECVGVTLEDLISVSYPKLKSALY